ncbi:MAG: amino acid decarboxylase, partial [Oscillospiraceae bacterium]|nr:amino acid decarboxylase [Oscillospiraceae bacterium]
EEALVNITRQDPIADTPPELIPPVRVMSLREACFSPWETVSVENAAGRVLAGTDIACPPAVPVAVCGELIDESAVRCMRYYGITRCRVVK